MTFSNLDPATLVTAAAILGLLALSAFFSGSETALTASSRAKLRAKADKGSRGAERALEVTEDNERMIGALLLGNNVVNILSASLATALMTKLFGDGGVAVATLVMTGLVLIFGEVLPKTLAISRPEAFSSRVAPVIRVLIFVFSPIVAVVRALCGACFGSWASGSSRATTCSPSGTRSRALLHSAIRRARSRRKTATGFWARSTCPSARSKRSCATAARSR